MRRQFQQLLRDAGLLEPPRSARAPSPAGACVTIWMERCRVRGGRKEEEEEASDDPWQQSAGLSFLFVSFFGWSGLTPRMHAGARDATRHDTTRHENTAYFNAHSHSWPVVKAALLAGLYPNVVGRRHWMRRGRHSGRRAGRQAGTDIDGLCLSLPSFDAP